MDDKGKNEVRNSETEVSASLHSYPLEIFKTDDDKYGNDITKMSDFFDGYIQQLSSMLVGQDNNQEVAIDFPLADIGIINDVIQQAGVVMRGNTILLPDFDNLPSEVRSKLKRGIYKIGESRQVDGNLRAVILDENGVRVKDVTLKKVATNPGNLETIRSLNNQIQMRQIYAKLSEIQEMQTYQMEKDRDRDIVIPFLDARSLVVESEQQKSDNKRIEMLREADSKVRTGLNAIYADLRTTSKSFAKCVRIPFLRPKTPINTYMKYLTSDLQLATKYVGVRMRLLEYLGDTGTAHSVLQLYQHTIYGLMTEPINHKGESVIDLLQGYFPYDKDNMDCWYHFSKEMKPVLKESMESIEISLEENSSNNTYVVSVEDIDE